MSQGTSTGGRLAAGDPAPDFDLASDDGSRFRLSAAPPGWYLLIFLRHQY
ncbi:MAG: hypothetical protein M0Z54_11830 [Thermaerobacter sp.]|nr:hypothetical protein [Thermaerobacter sp.]